jgi:hypothetical protein
MYISIISSEIYVAGKGVWESSNSGGVIWGGESVTSSEPVSSKEWSSSS